jgi:hypothetical protein
VTHWQIASNNVAAQSVMMGFSLSASVDNNGNQDKRWDGVRVVVRIIIWGYFRLHSRRSFLQMSQHIPWLPDGDLQTCVTAPLQARTHHQFDAV